MRLRVHLDRDDHALVHGRGQRLRAAHAAEPGGEHEPALERAAEVLARRLREGLVRALQDALGADVDPGAGRHLAVHHQALAVELVEVLPGGPGGHEHGVRDEHARRVGVGAEDRPPACRTARAASRRSPSSRSAAHDGVEALPVARGLADAAVDDEVLAAAPPPRGRGCSSACAARPPAARTCRRASVPRGARTTRAAPRPSSHQPPRQAQSDASSHSQTYRRPRPRRRPGRRVRTSSPATSMSGASDAVALVGRDRSRTRR